MGFQILGLKHKRNVSLLFRFQWQKLFEKLRFGQFFASSYLLLITQIASLCSSCSNLTYNNASSGIFFIMFKIWIYLKKIWKIKILLDLTRYLSCLFGLQKLLRLIIIVTLWVIVCIQCDSKRPTAKYLNFFRFF